jgi:hypothetical protein
MLPSLPPRLAAGKRLDMDGHFDDHGEARHDPPFHFMG